MAFKDDLFKNLTAEQRTAIEDSVGDDFDWDLVPRSRLNKVIGQRNDLRKQLGQPGTSKKKSKEDDSDDDDDKTYFTQEDVDALLAKKQKEFDDANSAQKLNDAVVKYLKDKKVRDPEFLIKAGLVDLKNAKLDKDGKVTGLDEATTALKTSHAYLFEDVQSGTGKGEDGAGSGSDGGDRIDKQLDALFADIQSSSKD